MAPILNRSPLAATCWEDGNGTHIRVYYQDTECNIRETFYDDGVGWARRDGDIVGKGKLNTPICVITWAAGTQIRVYFLTTKNQIAERCYDGSVGGSWFDGSLSTKDKFIAAPYSQLSAVGFGEGLKDCRVYYQDPSNKIRELVLQVNAERWTHGTANLPDAVPGTYIAATATTPKPNFATWVYYQQTDMKLVEYKAGSNGQWSKGGFRNDGVYPPGAAITAILWGEYKIIVYAVDEANQLTATAYTGSWGKTEWLGPLITRSDLAAVKLPTKGWIRVYGQSEGYAITEKGSNDDGKTYQTMEERLPVDEGN